MNCHTMPRQSTPRHGNTHHTTPRHARCPLSYLSTFPSRQAKPDYASHAKPCQTMKSTPRHTRQREEKIRNSHATPRHATQRHATSRHYTQQHTSTHHAMPYHATCPFFYFSISPSSYSIVQEFSINVALRFISKTRAVLT